uniref:Uncharacterized protein n=1 Tax=viral metagenome TaxID=1070528 RepID=A0A6C0CGP7_9ZZZZ
MIIKFFLNINKNNLISVTILFIIYPPIIFIFFVLFGN